MKEQWQGFKGSKWQDEVDVRDFIQNNYKPYNGDESFLEGPKESTNILWAELQKLQKEERAKGHCVLTMRKNAATPMELYEDYAVRNQISRILYVEAGKCTQFECENTNWRETK